MSQPDGRPVNMTHVTLTLDPEPQTLNLRTGCINLTDPSSSAVLTMRIALTLNLCAGWYINLTDPSGSAVNMTLIALTAQNLQPKNVHSFALYIAQR